MEKIMKIALAHDYLNQWGGAEKVLETLAEIFPEAPIYTLMYDKEKTYARFEGSMPELRTSRVLKTSNARKVKTSFLDFKYARENHRRFIPLMPLAAKFLKIPRDYDLIISSSAGFAKGFNIGKNTMHISYCHTPLRYAWESDSYLRPITNNLQLKLYKPLLNYLKNWDYEAGQSPDVLMANSEFIARKIKKCYGRDSTVVYPPVDLSMFFPNPIPHTPYPKPYFLAIGRFLHYKKFDLVIDAFNELGLPLKIVGSGPEEQKLKSLVKSDKIEFLPFQNDTSLVRELYWGARAIIFPQVEDFGLVAAEGVASGTPVIALNAGGAREIVNAYSGILFPKQERADLIRAVNNFISREGDYIPEIVSAQANKFSKENFVEKIKEAASMVTASGKTRSP
ncbi:MAG: glycosyltransferase [Candidatus Liptonbacteria bacterium]|nr:glycosyltransferase [Candidatus Liptonbacteria bacterium]